MLHALGMLCLPFPYSQSLSTQVCLHCSYESLGLGQEPAQVDKCRANELLHEVALLASLLHEYALLTSLACTKSFTLQRVLQLRLRPTGPGAGASAGGQVQGERALARAVGHAGGSRHHHP